MSWCHECEKEYTGEEEICPVCDSDLYEDIPPSMMQPEKVTWGFRRNTEKTAEWPKDERGENIPVAFLANIGGSQLDYEMPLSLLRAFSIPYVCDFAGAGRIVKICFGFSGAGMDIYVPETLLEDAKEILSNNSEE